MVMVDMLIKNATILTLDEEGKRADFLTSYKGKITGVWDKDEFKNAQSSLSLEHNYKEYDLKGKTLIPGFVDTHNHILMYAINKVQVDCSPNKNKNITDILSNLKKFHDDNQDEQWILGFGYDDTMLKENRHPTREDLDKVSKERPIFIKHISGHLAVANSAALEIAKLNATIEDPEGGHFGRDDQNNLNGVLYEPAVMDLVFKHVPIPSKKDLIELLRKASQDYVAQGITTNTDAGIGFLIGPEEYDAHIDAIKEKANPMRMRFMIMGDLLLEEGVFESYNAAKLNEKILKDSNGMAKLDSAKLFQDGSIQGLTGALRTPYHCDEELYGDLIFSQKTLEDMVLNFHDRGFRIATHGNGDRAIGSIIEAYKNAIDTSPRQDHRHRIEHVQTATKEDLLTMKEYEIAASFFINHVYYWGDRHKNIFLGPKRAERINPVKEADDLGLLYTLHSDCPITPISPLFSVWAAVNRLTRDGIVLGADQRIDVETALKSMISFGAKLNFEEEELGSLEVGKFADFVVLDQDPTAINPINIKDIQILSTIINGEVVYEKAEVEFALK
ncbi:amidohydrolase [Viridibacillus arvi]|uniref:amidohydrolase n=1 Tax=Viridibacillus arvi TaxID=263475 RepID=UPI00187B7B63|nr:amidohydrolase [Viridibacillus sp. JNUCC-6]QOV12227.1 amidohydrolase family protein [Viridibacillus sp. JNUCC-6]